MGASIYDHVIFEDCLDSFRRESECEPAFFPAGESVSFVLTSFLIDEDWVFDDFKIYASRVVDFGDGYIALASRINNPSSVGVIDTQEFGVFIATLLSFVSGRPVRAPRSRVLGHVRELMDIEWKNLGLTFPLSSVGPAAVFFKKSLDWQSSVKIDFDARLQALRIMPYQEFKAVMLAIRLVSLSINTKKDDFALGYSLLVAALEAVSQKAISEDRFKIPKEKMRSWKERCAGDQDLTDLYKRFNESNGNNKFSKKRFVQFVVEYAPIDEWAEYVAHPNQDRYDSFLQFELEHKYNSSFAAEKITDSYKSMVRKRFREVYPEDVPEDLVEKIFSEVYAHRSGFFHAGEQPPHKDAVSSDRFFQIYTDFKKRKAYLLPNYELLLGISRLAITNWIGSRVG